MKKEAKYATRWDQLNSYPKDIKWKIRKILRNSVLSFSSFFDRVQEENYLRGIYCHNVFDDQVEQFENILIRIKRIGEFVSTDDCIQMLNGKKKIDNKYFHLSFDDGFRNNFTNAIPILKKHNIPAIFFVPSSLMDADWDQTKQYCLETTKYKAVIELLKWDDLKEILKHGFDIGSHTRTHARFSDISNNSSLMYDEIFGSKTELEEKLEYNCKYISWPYGDLKDVDNESLQMVKDADYKACFGAYRGTIRNETNIYSIPRHHFEVHWPISHILYFSRGKMESINFNR